MLKVCSYCGSEDVKVDAFASWNKDENKWELESVYEKGICDDCDGEATIIDKEEDEK
jgi:hypothetical protein